MITHTGTFQKDISKLLFCLCVIIFWSVALGCQPVIALGKNPSGEDLKRIEELPNYRNGEFQNLESPPVIIRPEVNASIRRAPRWLGLVKYFIGKPKITRPSGRLPAVITDIKKSGYKKPTIIWFGHSSVLLKTATANILFDPNFSGYAGPFPGLVQAFKGSNVYDSRDMPEIDALVISHDHYDHLDYQTVKQLEKKVRRVIVPIGVGSHFRKWGYDPQKITELNWNDSLVLPDGVIIHATPAHHRSNRTFASRKTLWASYVVQADGYKIYFSGDTGYSKHFKLIGERYGPFDLALMECGQYNTRWSQSHMHPSQTAQASRDINAAMIIPIHWAKFAESMHPWNEPMHLLKASADSLKQPVTVPFIGQPYTIGDSFKQINWWDYVDKE